MSLFESEQLRGLARGFGLASGIGLNFAALVTIGALVGRHFDKERDGVLFTIIGVALGAVAALVNMIHVLAWYQRREERLRREKDE